MHRVRSVVMLALGILGACAGGPREGDRTPSFLPPPRLEETVIDAIGREAGADLAAATTLNAALGDAPIGFSRVANLIPYREIRAIDGERLRAAFGRACGRATIAHSSTWSLAVDALAFVHRAKEGTVSVEYSLDFLLVDSRGGTPWVKCVTRAAEGGRGELVPQALSLEDLDGLAARGAASVAEGLKGVHADAVHVVPRARDGPGAALAVAFEDRVRAALLALGVKLEGEAGYVVDMDASLEGVQRETGTETYELDVNLSRADSSIPFKPWRMLRTRSGP